MGYPAPKVTRLARLTIHPGPDRYGRTNLTASEIAGADAPEYHSWCD